MALDAEVEKAIREIATDLGQPDKVAKRLISWLKEMSEKDLSIEDDLGHLETLKQAIDIESVSK